MNTHLYSLQDINRMLIFMLSKLDFSTFGLFREGSNSSALALHGIFCKILFQYDQPNKQVYSKVIKAIEEYNLDFYLNSLIKEFDLWRPMEKPSQSQESSHPIAEESHSTRGNNEWDHITFNDWAVLCKEMVKNGKILDKENFDAEHLQIFCAWQMLLHQLKGHYPSLLTEDPSKIDLVVELENPALPRIIPNFLGQLCLLGQTESAQAIHNFLHLFYKASLQTDKNRMDLWALAKMAAPSLLDALELSGKIAPQNDDDMFGTQVLKQESFCIANLIHIVLRLPLFEQPFDTALYKNHYQINFEEEFELLQQRLLVALWEKDFFVTHMPHENEKKQLTPILKPATSKLSASKVHSKSDKSLIFSDGKPKSGKSSYKILPIKRLGGKQENRESTSLSLSTTMASNESLSDAAASYSSPRSSNTTNSSSPRRSPRLDK